MLRQVMTVPPSEHLVCLVGDRSLTYEMVELAADAGLAILTYSAEPGGRSEEGLNLLASWSATPA